MAGENSTTEPPMRNSGNVGSVPMLGRFPGEGNGNPLQYSWLGSPMDRGAWRAAVYRVAKELDTTWQLNNNSIVLISSLWYSSSK